MNNRALLAVGLVLAVLLPPSLTAFFIGVLVAIVTGQFPPVYGYPDVASALPFYLALYLLVEAVIVIILSGRGAKGQSRGLAALAAINLVIGVLALLSTMTCGLC